MSNNLHVKKFSHFSPKYIVTCVTYLLVACSLSAKNGIYEKNCGLENVMMSWGHDGKEII